MKLLEKLSEEAAELALGHFYKEIKTGTALSLK